MRNVSSAARAFLSSLFFVFVSFGLAQTAGDTKKIQDVKGTVDFDEARQVLKVSAANGKIKEFSTRQGFLIKSPDGSVCDIRKLKAIECIDWPPGYDPSATNNVPGVTNKMNRAVFIQQDGMKPLLLLENNESLELKKNSMGETTVKIFGKGTDNFKRKENP